jgi:hypothetical protein
MHYVTSWTSETPDNRVTWPILQTSLTNRRIRRSRQARLLRGSRRAILNADQFNVRQPKPLAAQPTFATVDL